MEDAAIVALYWARDEQALTETAAKFGAYCRKIADNILHSAHDAEECENDTWLAAWNSMPDNRQRQLLTDSTLPDGRMTKRTFPTTSATVHCSRATKEPSPRMYSRVPSLLMMRCSTCLPLYLKSTTSIG